jgi:rare lipoprotein A
VKTRVCCVFALAAGLSCSALAAGADDEWCGEAAWFDGGGLTASGEVNQAGALSAAHPSLPFGTRIQVDNLANGRSVVVRINDRASFAQGRVILVSRAAAEELGMVHDGRAGVRLSVVDGDRPRPGGCGGPEAIAEEPAAPEPPADETAVASAPADIADSAVDEAANAASPSDPADEVLLQSEGRVRRTEPLNPPPPARSAPPSDESLADRFAVAFRPESWQEAEFAKMLGAFAPRLTAPPARIPIPWPVLDRMTPIRLTPVLIAYVWSGEISLPEPTGFAHAPVSTRLSQLTQ